MKKKLEDAIRPGESLDDLVLLLRGGPDSKEKIFHHADRLEDAFTYHTTDLPEGSRSSRFRVISMPGLCWEASSGPTRSTSEFRLEPWLGGSCCCQRSPNPTGLCCCVPRTVLRVLRAG